MRKAATRGGRLGPATGILVVLLADIFAGAWATFRDRGLDFVLSGLSLNPETAGVWTGIIGSLIIAFFVILLAIPIGVGAAVYLEEYAPKNWLTRLLQTNIANLAGVPSIVYGILGLAIFVRFFGFGRRRRGQAQALGAVRELETRHDRPGAHQPEVAPADSV